MSENQEVIHVYCHNCKELIGQCFTHELAFIAEKSHREQKGHENCNITKGNRFYYDECSKLNKVIICINGGVAELVEKPFGVNIEIRDYDIEGDWDETNASCKEDQDGDRYQEIIWESTVVAP